MLAIIIIIIIIISHYKLILQLQYTVPSYTCVQFKSVFVWIYVQGCQWKCLKQLTIIFTSLIFVRYISFTGYLTARMFLSDPICSPAGAEKIADPGSIVKLNTQMKNNSGLNLLKGIFQKV